MSGDSKREYVCPVCGYDGYKSSPVKATGGIDVNVQYGCPVCATVRGMTVWLTETTDPRSAA